MLKKLFILPVLFVVCASVRINAEIEVDDQIIITKSRIQDRKIIITDNLGKDINYRIKGICFSPDIDGEIFYETYLKDIPLIRGAGANSIKTYRPLGAYNARGEFDHQKTRDILNAFFKNKITASVGFSYEDMAEGGLMEQYLAAFGNHPAILMIVLGNEYNYHYGEWFTKEEWLSQLKSAVKRAKRHIPNKIIAVAHGEMPSKQEYKEYTSAGADFIMMNMYRGSNFGFSKDNWNKISKHMPWGVSEFGRSSLDAAGKDTSKLQSSELQTLIRSMDHGYLFTLVDDPAKGDMEISPVIGREDAMGIYHKDGKPKIAVKTVKTEYDKIPGAVYID
ncbi:MAG: hypothetical protein LBR69_08045 [Endomicrobium sp.]|jgi:hypothetical protein|nr:hypothetical protein [Endomicrobium sp.]